MLAKQQIATGVVEYLVHSLSVFVPNEYSTHAVCCSTSEGSSEVTASVACICRRMIFHARTPDSWIPDFLHSWIPEFLNFWISEFLDSLIPESRIANSFLQPRIPNILSFYPEGARRSPALRSEYYTPYDTEYYTDLYAHIITLLEYYLRCPAPGTLPRILLPQAVIRYAVNFILAICLQK